MRFNVPTLGGTLLGAVLRLTPLTTSTPGVHGVLAMTNDPWIESGAGGMTWNNKPPVRSALSVWTPAVGTEVSTDVFQAIPSSGPVSLQVDAITQTTDGLVTYGSRENAMIASRPQLILTFLNESPVLSNFSNQTINEDSNTGAIPFNVGDEFTAPGALSVSGTSSNTALVPNTNIVFGGSGANRTLTVTPAADWSGTATIVVTVNDGALTTSATVTGGIMSGTGTVAGNTTLTGGTHAPGNSIGIMKLSGNYALNAAATLQTEINGPALGTQYDQVKLTDPSGSVTLAGGLDIIAAPGLTTGTIFTLIDNAGSAAVSGNFIGKPQGSAFAASEYIWIISYTRSLAAMTDGVSFMVQWSDNLASGTWSNAGFTEQILSDNGSTQTIKATIPAGSSGRRFAQLKVIH